MNWNEILHLQITFITIGNVKDRSEIFTVCRFTLQNKACPCATLISFFVPAEAKKRTVGENKALKRVVEPEKQGLGSFLPSPNKEYNTKA